MKEETSYLWISELPPNVTQQSLTDLFSSHGCVLTKIYEAGNLRGALLSFLDAKTAAKACAASHLLNGQSLISEYCDQSGEPGLQRLKDLASSKFSEKAQVGKQEGSKLKVLKVWNFPDRSPDSSVQSGLYHEYKKVGKVTSVQVLGEKDDRHALIVFKRAEDAETAYELTRSGKSFFGMTLNVERLEEAAGESGHTVDEFDVRATRTVILGGIEPSASEADVREALAACGTVLDVELKPPQQTGGPMQAIAQFADIRGAAAALRRPEGMTISGKRVRPSYGRSQTCNCVWLANLAETVTEALLSKTFACHGRVRDVCVNSHRQCALVFFDEVEDACRAVDATKGGSLAGQRLLVDFASQLCQKHFVDELVTSGQCSSNYKLFEQLFASELHRGIIPSRKAAARYREMMLEYVKANSHRPWLKVHDCPSSTEDAGLGRESAPSDPAELRAVIGARRRLASGGGGGGVRRKSGHSSDGDVSSAKEGEGREQRLLARLSGFEDTRSECSDAETSGSTAEQFGPTSDSDRPAAPTGWLTGWQRRRKSQSPPLSSRSPASALPPPSSRQAARPAESSVSGITPVSPQPTGQAASEQDARCLEQAVSAYEAALGTHAPLGGLFDCASPGADVEGNAAAGEEEAHSSSTMPTPPETSVSPTPPLLPSGRPSAVAKRETPARLPVDTETAEFDIATWEDHPYESMYDKIKRRQASRTISSTSDAAVRVPRPSDGRRPEDTPSRKRPRPRASTSRQHSAADASESDTDDEAIGAAGASMMAPGIAPAAAAARPRQPHPPGHGARPRGRKSTAASSDAGTGSTSGRRGSSAAAKAPSAKRPHRAPGKSGKLSRGKMSVDSVFGSSSDSEEAGAPATPSTIPMTDSSRAESLVDPGSPRAASRLTDIFAEVKAQLDPRAVTEKSLFAFSDDEAFEPAPDLPTIDRFQPDASAPSPDRSDDAEPPKLAAAHADLETTAAHALAQLSQRPPAITLSQPQLTLRPLIPAPPPPLPPAPQTQTIVRPAAPESLMLQHPMGPASQPTRPPMQPAAQQDLDQFVQDVIRKVQAAPPNQTAAWDRQTAVDAASAASAASVPPADPATTTTEASGTTQQPTISLTGGLAQRPPAAKRSQPAMEATALQHMVDVIHDVVEGHVDLSPYMERGRLRCPSGERFTATPVPPAVVAPARPPSDPLPAAPQPLSMPTTATTGAPELRLQPVTICPVTTSAAIGVDVSSAAPLLQQHAHPHAPPPSSSIAMTSLPATTSTPTDAAGAGDATFTQRMQQQQQQQQQQTQTQVQLQALYMQLFSGRYPQDLMYGPYVPPSLQLFQPAAATPQPPAGPPAPPAPAQSLPPQAQAQAPSTTSPQPAPQQPQQEQQQQQPQQPQQQAQGQSSGQSSGQLDALLRKYPVKWQGHLALKNDEAGVQMHFVRGSDTLAKAALELAVAAPDAGRVLKVAQRMRMEPAQLEGVQRKMVDEAEFCVLLAVACGVNAQDYRRQTHNLREAFIKYLQEKQAAGIVNVNYPDQEVPAYVVHIFPPGQFATAKLQQYACDLYANLFPQPSSETPHLLVVVTTV